MTDDGWLDPAMTTVWASRPERWHHPKLGREEALGRDAAARALLAGLAAPRSLLETGRDLVARGDFELAATMMEQAPLPASDIRALARALELARAVRRADHERRLLSVERRRVTLGGEWDPCPPTRIAAMVERGQIAPHEVEAQIAELENAARGWEVDLAKDLSRRAHEAGGSREWKRTVEECIESGEYGLAQSLLDDPNRIPDGGPAGLPPLPAWSTRGSLPDVLDDLLGRARPGPAGPGSLVPAGVRPLPYDSDAWQLILALDGVGDGATPAAVCALLDALHRLLHVHDVPCAATPDGAGVRSTLFLAPDARLPPLPSLDHGLGLWVGGAAARPPVSLQRPALWLVPDLETDASGGPGLAVLSAGDLLALLVPPFGDAPPRPGDRQMQLLRLAGRQWGAGTLLGVGPLELGRGPSPEHRLAWVLDLLGFRVDAVTRSALLQESGAQAGDLRVLVDALLDGVPAATTPTDRIRWIGHADLQRLREDPEITARRLRGIDDLLAPHPLARALLVTAAWLKAGTAGSFDVDDLQQGLAVLCSDHQTGGDSPGDGVPALELVAVVEAARLLVRLRLWSESEGAFRMARIGLLAILASVTDAESRVRTALATYHHRAAQQTATGAQRVRDLIARTLDHTNANVERDIIIEAERMTAADGPEERGAILARIKLLQSQRVDYKTQQELAYRPPSSHRVREIVDAQLRRLAEKVGSGISPTVHPGGDPVVEVNDWLLGEALWCLIDNARLAIPVDPATPTYGWVDVRLSAASVLGGYCTIDIEDSGTGIDETALEHLRRGERYTTRHGNGEGFQVASEWFRSYGGDLEVLAARGGPLGGARVRGTLPVVPPEEGTNGAQRQ